MFVDYNKKILFFVSLFSFIINLPLYSQSGNENFYGIWVVRNNLVSKEKIDNVINIASEKGFNNLIVQVRGRGEAYYKSRIVPIADKIKSNINNFDPLQYFISEAHKKNIKLHCWFNVFFLWSSPQKPKNKNHLYYKNPEWFCVPHNLLNKNSIKSRNHPDLIFLSPGIDEVRFHLVDVIEEVVNNYKIDGIHLDYIRYPGENFGYNIVLRNKFLSANKIDPLELIRNQEDIIEKIGQESYINLIKEWKNFRGRQVNHLVKEIKECIKKKNPSIKLSAAVIPDLYRAKNYYYQYWNEWVNQKLIDFVIPMNYTVSKNDFEDNIAVMLKNVPKEKIIMGISAANQSKYKLASKVYLTKSKAIRNFCIFSFDFIDNSINMIDLF